MQGVEKPPVACACATGAPPHPLIEPVIDHGKAGFAGAGVAGEAGVAVIAGGHRDARWATLGAEAAARTIGQAARAGGQRDAGEPVGSARRSTRMRLSPDHVRGRLLASRT